MFTSLTLKRVHFFFVPVWQVYNEGKCIVRFLSHDKAEEYIQNIYDYEARYAIRRVAMKRHPSGRDK
jgi:hypothetical protein